jgi:WD repeat-containing protein 42A
MQTETSKDLTSVTEAENNPNNLSMDIEMADDDIERSLSVAAEQLLGDDASEQSDTDNENESDSGGETSDFDVHSDVSVVLPRSRFLGHCNVATVKDG